MQKGGVSICTSRGEKKITPSPATKSALPDTFLINLMQPFAVRTGASLSLSARMSQQMKTGWEKSFTCGHTRDCGESLHYEACGAQTERWRGWGQQGAVDDCALHQMFRCGQKLTYVMCRRGDNRQSGGSGEIIFRVNDSFKPWPGRYPVVKPRARPLTLAGRRPWKD